MDDDLLRSVAERAVSSPERVQLQRLDWIAKALEIFVGEGIDAVRIMRLAGELEVTRGSFYWHFANRAELVDALVKYWQAKNTPAIVEAVAAARSLADGVLRFFEACVDPQQFDPRLDLAVREWARRSPPIRAQMEEADNARIEALKELFRRFGYAHPDSFIRARVIYFAQIGFYALDVKEPMKTRLGYLESYFTAFTGRRLSHLEAEAFRGRLLDEFSESQS